MASTAFCTCGSASSRTLKPSCWLNADIKTSCLIFLLIQSRLSDISGSVYRTVCLLRYSRNERITLSSAICQFHFRRMVGHFAFIVILIERNGFVVPLNQPSARCVVPRGRQCQSGVLAQSRDCLHQSFAERGLAHN